MARKLTLAVDGDSAGGVRALERVADRFERTGHAAERLGDRFTSTTAAAIRAGIAFRDTDGRLRDARGSFLSAAGAAEMLAKGIDDVGDQARQSARAVDELGDELGEVGRKGIAAGLATIAGRFASFGAKAGSAFGTGLSSALSTLATTGPVVVAVAGLGIALGGLLSGAIVSALLLGLGGGILAGGIALAFSDPRVDRALRGATETFTAGLQARPKRGQIAVPHGEEQTVRTSEGLLAKTSRIFKQAAEPLVPNLVAALDSLSALLDRIGPKIGDLFKTMRPAIEPLTRFLTTFVESALPGIQAAAEASLPLFEKLAEHGPKLGAALSKFFDILAVAMPLAVVAFGDLLTAIEVLLPAVGFVLTGFLVFYTTLRDGAIAAKNVIVDVFSAMIRNILTNLGYLINGAAAAFGWIPGIGPKLKEAAAKFNEFAAAVNIALASIKDRDVSVRVKTSVTDLNGKRVTIGEGGTIPIRGAYAEGGPVPGPPGAPQLAVVHGGEFVLSREMLAQSGASARTLAGSASAPYTVNVYVTGSVVSERQLLEVIEANVSRLGGSPSLLGLRVG